MYGKKKYNLNFGYGAKHISQLILIMFSWNVLNVRSSSLTEIYSIIKTTGKYHNISDAEICGC